LKHIDQEKIVVSLELNFHYVKEKSNKGAKLAFRSKIPIKE